MAETPEVRDISYQNPFEGGFGAIRRLKAASIVLTAAIALIAVFGIFKGEQGAWMFMLPTAIALFAFGTALLILRKRLHTLREAKRVRDSLLKHVWEERHRREW